eukprot:CAMPEP_0172499204 /NCGR_PEP_ID=MMETSP1066-20121228/123805_1 /TAXON_ID=671091 /ORGANISM="Coscinodiscus wailesii, Strain CCMP2513" /LENGTH=614 /DNA_ID=CAMNT_0013272817 /DNA_START=83 /DNA_END=1927 /DNA_ORIENTATION=+
MSSHFREIENRSASLSAIHPVQILYSENQWETSTEAPDAAPCGGGVLNGMALQNGTTIRVGPMDRKFGGWDNEHFNEDLCISETDIAKGMVVTFEAMARECVAIALSPTPSFQMGKTYVAHFGANGNLASVLRRHTSEKDSVETSVSGRVCDDSSFQSYWIIFSAGKLSVGMGTMPGRECMATLDDSIYHQLRPGQDAVRFVGLGNSALGKYARDLKVRNVVVSSCPTEITITEPKPMSLPVYEESWAEYQKECDKARQRAIKFEIDYVPPDPNQFLKFSEARKLRANPERGFITGIDLESAEEIEKRKRRRERFEKEGGDQVLQELEEDDGATKEVPAEQAWDKEDIVKEIRVDPPESLWRNCSDEQGEAMMTEVEGNEQESLVLDKIHIFAIDWAAFKQIRAEDIIDYFSAFGPKNHVEWLGELSANILFEDKYSANRALRSLSQQLPAPPDDSKPDFASMGWRLCIKPITKKRNDTFGKRGTYARLLMRTATSLDILEHKPTKIPKPPKGFTTKKKLGPESDLWEPKQQQQRKKKRRNSDNRKNRGSNNNEKDDASDEDMVTEKLNEGLKSKREGFSVEDMQKEREAAAALVMKAASDAVVEGMMDQEKTQ